MKMTKQEMNKWDAKTERAIAQARARVNRAKADIKLQPSVRKALLIMLEEIFRQDREGDFTGADEIDNDLSCFKNPSVIDVLVTGKKVRAVVNFNLF